MRIIHSFLFALAILSTPGIAKGQTIVCEFDTTWSTPPANMYNRIKVTTGATSIKWKVVSSNFPSDWLPHFGFCDNVACYTNGSAGALWPTGSIQTTVPIDTGFSDFYLQLDLPATATPGIYYIRVKLYNQTDLADSNTIQTYYASFSPTNVRTVAEINQLSLYPNPTKGVLYVTGEANINKIVIRNLSGHIVYSGSYYSKEAKVDLRSLPAGIYTASIDKRPVRTFVKQ